VTSLWQLQLRQLFKKRCICFVRRPMIACLLIVLPIVLQLVACHSITKETSLISKLNGNPDSILQARILDIGDYGPQTMLYSVTESDNSNTDLTVLFDNFYSRPSKASIQPIRIDHASVDAYIMQARKQNLKNLFSTYYAAMEFNRNSTESSDFDAVTIFYSTLAYHSSANVLHELGNLLLAYYNNNSLTKTIQTRNHPIRNNQSIKNFYNLLSCYDIMPISVFSLITSLNVAFVISMMILHVSTDRIESSKALQYISSGIHYLQYWLANYLFDLMVCFVVVTSIVLVVFAWHTANVGLDDGLFGHPAFSNLVLSMYVSGISWPVVAYIWSFAFKHEFMPFIVVFMGLGLVSLVDVLLSFLQLYGRLNMTFDSSIISLIDCLRICLMVLFPNITVKHLLTNLKIRSDSFCINSINYILKSESIFSLIISGQKRFLIMIQKQKIRAFRLSFSDVSKIQNQSQF
jgi:hypothetical protein